MQMDCFGLYSIATAAAGPMGKWIYGITFSCWHISISIAFPFLIIIINTFELPVLYIY